MTKKTPLVALAAVLASAGPAGRAPAAAQPDRVAPLSESPSQLRVSGHISGLYPGARKSMRVTVRNGLDYPVRLLWVRADAAHAGPRCPGATVITGTARPRVRIRPHAARAVGLSIAMRGDAPNACQAATFPLRFSAQARVQGRPGEVGNEESGGTVRPGAGQGQDEGEGLGGETTQAGGGGGLPFTGHKLAAIALAAITLLGAGAALRRFDGPARRGP